MSAMKPAWDAVIFDYGGVLCYSPSQQDISSYGRESGMDKSTFLKLYAETREFYGMAADGYAAHWHRIAEEAGLKVSEPAVKRFIDRESELWTRPNMEVLALARDIKAAGRSTAILSNMTHELLKILRTKFDWLEEFDVRIWSCERGCAKPDETIYRACLSALECEPGQVLFFDDRLKNVEGARQAGIDAHLFESAQQARAVVKQGIALP